jgi:hypothetical protein
MTVRSVLNSVSGSVFIGMGCWELVTVKQHPSTAMDINDIAMCFIYTIGIFNILMGCASLYICFIQCKDPERSERYAVNISTGISIWGLILYFRYSSFISSIFYKIILAETISFFSRIGIIMILVCGSCLKQDEVIPVTTDK